MATIVRSENDLPTLRVHLKPEAEPATAGSSAVFEVLRGRGDAKEILTVSTRELGLADRIRSGRDVPESQFRLGDAHAAMIMAALRDIATPDDRAFWLELASPRGYLHILPWERLLAPVLDRPLLRLPNFVLRPHVSGPSLRVVLAAGRVPSRPWVSVADMVVRITEHWLKAIERSVLVEVFIDSADAAAVRARFPHNPAVVVHDAPEHRPDAAPWTRNEWINWVASALAGKATDIVHVITHGTLLGDQGALALPSIVTRDQSDKWPATLGAVELCRALDRIGAWSLMISSPPQDPCPTALRELADAVAQARPGVVALHDWDVSETVAAFDPVLRMIYDGVPPGRQLSSVMCWCHPSFVASPQVDLSLCGPDGTTALLAEATRQVLAQADTPAWVAASARSLEALQAQLVPSDGTAPDPQAVAALRTVSALLERHVRAFAGPEAGERT